MGAIFETDDLHYVYGGPHPVEALRGINLGISAGEYVAIVGANGSGKSTLVRHLNGLLTPTHGAVRVLGRDTLDPAQLRAIRQAVQMVFQQPDTQIVATTVEEDTAFGPENFGVAEAELPQRVEDALRTVGMWERRARPPHLLSSGQKQRVAIAGALAVKPQALLLDEATAMLDPAGRAAVLETLRFLHGRGTTIVTITHEMDEAAEAERVIVLDRGRVALDGTPRAVFAREDELRGLGLDVPPVTGLALRLGLPACLTPDELLSALGPYSAKTPTPGAPSLGAHEDIAEHPERRAAARSRRARSGLPGEAASFDSTPLSLRSAQDASSFSEPQGANASGPSEAAIRVQDLRHTYLRGLPFETAALRGATLEIGRGEITGLIGQTGSGKSTLMQHLNGLMRPQAGHVIVEDRDLADPATDVRAIRRIVGMLFQQPEDQLFERYVGDDVAFGPRQMGLERAEVRARVAAAMEAVGLGFEAFKDRLTQGLSGGERRRAALAGVLALDSPILVADEPTAGLDPRGRAEVLNIFRRMNQEGKTVVFTSHRMGDIAALCDQVVALADGRTVAAGPARDVLGRPALIEQHGLPAPALAVLAARLRAAGWPIPEGAMTVDELSAALLCAAALSGAALGRQLGKL